MTRRLLPIAVCALAALCAAMAHAGDADSGDVEANGRKNETWMAVSNNTLDELRGGFDLGQGLVASFGITRAVYINGSLATQTTLNFDHLTSMTPAQAAALNQQMSALNLVQTGPGNSAAPQVGAVGGTIVQNSLNNQNISNQTIINARTNSMGMMKDLNTLSTLNDSLARAVGGR